MSVSPLHAPSLESTNPLDELYEPDSTPLVRDSKGKPQKYIRTVMLVDGEYKTARITVETGEIKPYNYAKKKDDKPKARPSQATIDARATQRFSGPGDLLGYVPHWVTIAPPERSVAQPDPTKPGAMRKSKPNPNGQLLADYLFVTDAIEAFPCLDDMFVGCANLDAGGNTRPMNTGLLFSLLRDLNDINIETIQAYTGCSESHSYKLAAYLRILSTAFDTAVDNKLIA
jgi:hypothetical protein